MNWMRLARKIVGVPVALLLLLIAGIGRCLDEYGDRGYDAVMDWMHGNDRWRYGGPSND
jgi:hypothetical protein